ncbi:erythromycin esterase family protein [Paenibacillus chartarius]|uniref:Erythromycin esterase family protein n=1 Tax=Paenibacillus chartarius TaxID=747481 RepID=A0ABV6DET2_9BACL
MAVKRQQVIDAIRRQAQPLQAASDLDALVQAAAGAKVVLLGEASHGTSEFYRWRTELTKRLITEHGYHFIAVEGDWPPCYEVNKYVKRMSGAKRDVNDTLASYYDRWPSWMWANEEVRELVEWLRSHNERQADGRGAGFYGMDVYSLWESMEAIMRHLEQSGQTELLETAKTAFSCFEPHGREGQQYGLSAVYWAETCEDEVVRLLQELQDKRQRAPGAGDAEAALSDELNALVARNAEQYYRTMIRSDSSSWNVRDEHMTEALDRLLKFHGPEAKAIVWEHNTHIGDARATDMAREGMVNVGQLVRERYGRENCYAIGFGTHSGTVIAGKSWGAKAETMRVPAAVEGSWEDLVHEGSGGRDVVLMFSRGKSEGAGTRAPDADGKPMQIEDYDDLMLAPEPDDRDVFMNTFDHRAIGVVYHPGREHWGNYVPSVMADRYDAFIFINRSEALHPLAPERVGV